VLGLATSQPPQSLSDFCMHGDLPSLHISENRQLAKAYKKISRAFLIA
jgi:hypothetical protein